MRDRIEREYPTHHFIGEESFAGGETADLTTEPTWVRFDILQGRREADMAVVDRLLIPSMEQRVSDSQN